MIKSIFTLRYVQSLHCNLFIKQCRLIFNVLIVLNVSATFGNQPLQLIDSISEYSIGHSLLFFEDVSGKTGIDSIVQPPFNALFKPVSTPIPNYGYSSSAYWYKLTLYENSKIRRDWVLDVAMPNLHNVDFYVIDSTGIIDSNHTGFTIGKPEHHTHYRNPSIEISNFSGRLRTVYVRIKSETAIITPVILREKQRHIEYERIREFVLGIYFGAIFILAIYHLYLSVSTKDKGYLWLSLFAFTYAFSQMTSLYGYIINWRISSPESILRLLHVMYFLAIYFGIVLSQYFTQSKKYAPKCDMLLTILQYIILLLIPSSLLMSFMLADRIFLLMKIIPLPLYIIAAIVAHRKGNKQAYYYLIATSSFIAGILVYNGMYGFGLLPYNTFIYFIPNITILITLSLYSISIADKINTYKREREQAREQAVNDLNAKLQIQEEMCAIEKELEQSRKMELVGRLLSGVAHDINNFLNPILGYALLIKKHSRDKDVLYTHASQLTDATQQLKELSSTLLDITRKNHYESTAININDAAEKTASLLKHSARKGVSVTVQLSEKNIILHGDRGMIHNAILNIGINALDAIEETGIVTISTAIHTLNASTIFCRKFGAASGQYAGITISDTGKGMTQEVLDHLFEPYFTTKIHGKGTGLGLANVYNCVKLHQGCVDVHSNPGNGSTIVLYFQIIPT